MPLQTHKSICIMTTKIENSTKSTFDKFADVALTIKEQKEIKGGNVVIEDYQVG